MYLNCPERIEYIVEWIDFYEAAERLFFAAYFY